MYSVVNNENETLYILIHYGEVVAWETNKEDALFAAHDLAEYYISDFLRHKLPLKLSKDDCDYFDLYLFAVTKEQAVEIPFQDWVDDYYSDMKEEKAAAPIREYQRYLELKEKWEGKEPPV